MTKQIIIIALAALIVIGGIIDNIADNKRRTVITDLKTRLDQAQKSEAQSRARAQILQAELEKQQQAAAAREAELAAALAKNPAWANQALPPDIAAALNERNPK